MNSSTLESYLKCMKYGFNMKNLQTKQCEKKDHFYVVPSTCHKMAQHFKWKHLPTNKSF